MTNPSTSKCCEKCYDPYSTQGYEVDSPCGNPNCPCHTTRIIRSHLMSYGSAENITWNYTENMKESHNNQWEKEFEVFFKWDEGFGTDEAIFRATLLDIKSFISKLRQSAIQEERERLARGAEGVAKFGQFKFADQTERGWFIKMADILSLIRTNTK